MLEIIAALTLMLWTLGLFSGSALGAAVYVLPIVALTALALRVYESLRSRARPQAVPPRPEIAPARSAPAVQSRSATEHARAA